MTTDLGMPGLPVQPVAERRKSRQIVVGKGKHAVPVGGGAPHGAHLVNDRRDAAPGDLPGGLATREPAADDVNWPRRRHGRKLGSCLPSGNGW